MASRHRRWAIDADSVEPLTYPVEFALRWQDRIDEENRAKRLPAVQHRVLCRLGDRLLRFCQTTGHICPSQATLADEAWCSIGTVKNACISAVLLGLLHIVERKQEDGTTREKRQTSNEYYFLLPVDAIPGTEAIREWKTSRWAQHNQRRWESRLRLADARFFDAELARHARLLLPGLGADKLCPGTTTEEYTTNLSALPSEQYRKSRASFCGQVLHDLAQRAAIQADAEDQARKLADRNLSDADEQRLAETNRTRMLAEIALMVEEDRQKREVARQLAALAPYVSARKGAPERRALPG